MSAIAITGKAALSTLQGVASLDRMEEARKDRALQTNYVTELVTAYRSIDTLAVQVDGAKAKHGAYIYRNLEELATKNGKVTLPDGRVVPLGKAVGEALGKVLGDGGVKELSSASATRYKWISRVYFDAGITESDPDYADIVNYYVSDTRLTEVLKSYKTGEAPAKDVLAARVRAAVELIRNPPAPVDPNVIPGESVEGADGSGSQDPENPDQGADVGGSAEDTGAAGASTDDNREPRPNDGGATLSDNGARLERIMAELSAMTVPDADDCASLFAVRAMALTLLEGALEVDRLEGRSTYERLSK